MDNYNFGRSKEGLVANFLNLKGFVNVQLTPGSRGWHDVAGQYPIGGKWILVQVKASRMNVGKPTIATDDKIGLKDFAVNNRHEAWIAYVVGSDIEWEHLA